MMASAMDRRWQVLSACLRKSYVKVLGENHFSTLWLMPLGEPSTLPVDSKSWGGEGPFGHPSDQI